ncbi:HI1450 family dsDNA-mimic protein [Providencia sp. PROV188]|jgi:uncharacterized protein YciU (UPF0263 family)|uniref:HI1450 family dsDNA-mimic protein n=1 Tax=Providencia TaxID=586 RepID=UPI0003E241CF|nr:MULTISPECIES: HI1450 family dsDNA-mimic protein [Providencia]ETS98055.1 PF04269 family protein [Providencia alcalifaciens PAL-3]EUD00884.1 PF04269 family protein [Providencia alcalifaciens PAL-1]MBG5882225.1 DUF440 family protein [Providencia alcalifaciens]MDR2241501.1 HI1450 family dsDNA-mimic protein [Providencia alcalifaciens]MTB46180.1 DUF440 family protein [Providencia sp. wls1950]
MSQNPSINLIDEDEIIEIAYDLFLEGAMDNLEPADQVIFALQFEECGAAEIVPFSQDWHILATQGLPLAQMSEVVIGLAKSPEDEIDDIFARILISRNPKHPFQHIEWKQ